jgi:hypothetical protein
MLKVIGIAVGALLAFGGLVAGAGGVSVLATIGSDGKVSSGQQTFATSGAALVSESADLRRPDEVSDIVGDPRVQLDLRSAKPVFVGVGPAKDVERYLAGAPIDEVTDFEVSPFKMEHSSRGGSKRLTPPGQQSFWVAQGAGTLDWKAGSGEYRVVVMNADGSRGVATRGDASVTIPHTAAIAWSLVGGGLLLLIMGAVTIGLAMRRPDEFRDSAQGPTPMSVGAAQSSLVP